MARDDAPVTDVARVEKGDLILEDHGPMLTFTFAYDSGWHQGIGYIVDLDFILGFMRACGVWKLADCVGSVVKVTHTDTGIRRIEPMTWNQGSAAPFDVAAWCEKHRRKEATNG